MTEETISMDSMVTGLVCRCGITFAVIAGEHIDDDNPVGCPRCDFNAGKEVKSWIDVTVPDDEMTQLIYFNGDCETCAENHCLECKNKSLKDKVQD